MMNKPSSLYVHVPFCESICDYCDFSKLLYNKDLATKYLKELKKEIDSYKIDINQLKTLYIGGGTPTALDDDLFDDLLSFFDKFLTSLEEYTVEANPESLSENKILILKKHHVNRVSIGVESTDDKILKLINRKHSFNQVEYVISLLRKHCIDNINVDLIIGLPHVSKRMFAKDLENILSLDPTHISIYSLTIHDHTMFKIKDVKTKSDDYIRSLYDYAHTLLINKGYIHYEVSNFSKPEFQSKHNMVYWDNKEYIGVGLSACGYVDNIRYSNVKSILSYLDGNYVLEREILSSSDKKTYQIILNLRTTKGLNLKEYMDNFNENPYLLNKKYFDSLILNKLAIYDKKNDIISLSYEGMMILDSILLNII